MAHSRLNSRPLPPQKRTETPIQTLLSLTTSSLSPEEKSEVEKQCKVDLIASLSMLEEVMISNTFLSGERMTITDIAFFAEFMTILKLGSIPVSFPSLIRLFMTIGSDPKVAAVVGDVSSLASPSGPPSVSSGWDRHRIRVKELLAEGAAAIGNSVVLKGWIRTVRSIEKGDILFVELTDGSTVKGIQLVMVVANTPGAQEVNDAGGAGASISVTGTVVESPGAGQTIEGKGHYSV